MILTHVIRQVAGILGGGSLLIVATSLQASDSARETGAITPRDEALMVSEGILGAHPDLCWRREGLREIEAGNIEKGVLLLRR